MSVRNLRVAPEGATAEVMSHTDPEKWYTVVKAKDGEMRCTCPRSFIKREECKHINEAETEIYLYSRKPEPGRLPGMFVARIQIGGAKYVVAVMNYSRAGAVTKIRDRYPSARIDLSSVQEYTDNGGVFIQWLG